MALRQAQSRKPVVAVQLPDDGDMFGDYIRTRASPNEDPAAAIRNGDEEFYR